MRQSTIERVLDKIEKCRDEMSLGYKRYVFLPNRVQRAMKQAYYLQTGRTNNFIPIVDFLASLSLSEYKTWLKAQ
ncbi:hypothetical protein [Vibrio agarivorans]|uniref:hypothetical protein n=1 Tax=Vibrio agarivorans TaxID=153622 RepID=UPI0025B2FD00|nr:hypothetical protein [Vibrio agarivorans]MDN3661121.1 hypothetical protein [Vibrio agarivorans]